MQVNFEYRPLSLDGEAIVALPVTLTIAPITICVGASPDDWEISGVHFNGYSIPLDHPLAVIAIDYADAEGVLSEIDDRWSSRHTRRENA